MAREDDDFRTRRLKRERQEAEEEGTGELVQTAATEKLEELIKRAEPMIEQVNSLYQQYINGTERQPPLDRRRQLEQVITSLTMMHKPTATLRFRISGVLHTFQQYRDRWDRTMRDIESGKVKRRGPGAG